MGDHEKFTTISHLVPGRANYYNIFCQVISCYTCPRGYVYLRVWDGTRNPMGSLISSYSGLNLIYGDAVKEKRVAADNKLFEATCYDEHGRAATALKPGDYVALVNVHFHIPTSCQNPALVMHDGPGKIRTYHGFKSAGRKILKITPEVSRTGFNYIDSKIKTHEATLPQLPAADADEQVPSMDNGVSDDTWNEFLGIEPTEASPEMAAPTAIKVERASPAEMEEVTPSESSGPSPAEVTRATRTEVNGATPAEVRKATTIKVEPAEMDGPTQRLFDKLKSV